jgi:sugar phosphate permease
MRIKAISKVNPVIRWYILSEFFFWSAWNTIGPVFSIFLIRAIPGSNISVATMAYSLHLVVRIVLELSLGRFFSRFGDRERVITALIGIMIVGVCNIGFAFIDSVWEAYVLYSLAGFGFGIAQPQKMAFFSTHLDKHKEAFEWSLYDAATMGGTAVVAIAGGWIVHNLGFQSLFAIAAMVNFVSMLPFIFMLDMKRPR